MIQVLDKSFEILIENSVIESRIQELAQKISVEYDGKNLICIVVLNGAFMFASDLMKAIKCSVEISFVKFRSYQGMSSSASVNQILGLDLDIKDRDILIIEDIVDTGHTIFEIKKVLKTHQPKSLKCCSLLFKPDSFQYEEAPDFVGFKISDKFVVGYGLDYNENGRNLKEIYQLKDT